VQDSDYFQYEIVTVVESDLVINWNTVYRSAILLGNPAVPRPDDNAKLFLVLSNERTKAEKFIRYLKRKD
jgi:hypothetical protein